MSEAETAFSISVKRAVRRLMLILLVPLALLSTLACLCEAHGVDEPVLVAV
jgi:hypothetical protein